MVTHLDMYVCLMLLNMFRMQMQIHRQTLDQLVSKYTLQRETRDYYVITQNNYKDHAKQIHNFNFDYLLDEILKYYFSFQFSYSFS